jgi:hypothetical protein
MSLVTALKKNLDNCITNLEHEDGPAGRCLFSNDNTRPALVKLPKFTGDPAEDFTRFKKEVEKAFLINRVTRSDQAAKLRECLSGHAKSIVPSSMEDIADAWVVLNIAFGDPAGRGSSPIKKQVEWLLSLEISLQDIVELGNRSSDMDREAFSGGTLSKILSLFPLNIQAELTICKGDGKEKLLGIIEEVKKLREIRQELLQHDWDAHLSHTQERREVQDLLHL